MNTHIKALTLTGLALAFCFMPLSSAKAHDSRKMERHYTKNHHSKHHMNNRYHTKHHINKHHARNYRENKRMRHSYKQHIRKHRHTKHEHYAHKYSRHKKVIVHKHAPKKVIYVYKERNDDYRDKILAAVIAQTALLLTLD